jgi:branched-chain amino acid transport system permease protein
MTLRTVVALVVCALALLVLPWIIGNEFYVNMATQVLIYALFALSINMMLGYGGMVSLGHAGYLGIAGYACILAVTAGYDHLTSAIFAVAVSTAAAAFFGLLSLRAPGLGFIMITLALGQIVWGIAYRANDLTGGDNGIRYPARPMPFGFDLRDAASFYYFPLAVFVVALFCIWRFSRSPFGASLMGARDQPRRMRMLGYNVWLIQWLTFVMAGFWASIAGVLYVYYNLFLSPHAISLQQSAEILLMAILGGASTLTGPIVGAAIITLVKNVISTYVERWNTLLGLIFVVVIMFMPYGLVPGCAQLWRRVRNRGKTPKTTSAALASEASGQRGDSQVHAPDTRPVPGSSARAAPAGAATRLAKITNQVFLGNINEYYATLSSGQVLRVQTHPLQQFKIGEEVAIEVDATQCSVFRRAMGDTT